MPGDLWAAWLRDTREVVDCRPGTVREICSVARTGPSSGLSQDGSVAHDAEKRRVDLSVDVIAERQMRPAPTGPPLLQASCRPPR